MKDFFEHITKKNGFPSFMPGKPIHVARPLIR